MPRDVPDIRRERSLIGTPNPEDTDAAAKGAKSPLITDAPSDLFVAYEVRSELGRGGMGTVYLARNRMMDRLEVIKVMNADIAAKPGVADRFLKEIQAAARLDHPNVVTAYTALRPGGGLALAMAYVDGIDLDKLVKANGPLSVSRACDYAAQAARGLEHAREAGLTHRDIKPSNLMVARVKDTAVVKVLDFGLAKFKELPDETGLTREGQMIGTPAYVAPEQAIDASKADTRADVYSLGCTLYYLIAGRPPFDGGVMQVLAAHAVAPPPPLPDVCPEVPADLWAVVARMLAKNPADRYQTPGDVEAALLPFLRPDAGTAVHPGVRPLTIPVPPAATDPPAWEYERPSVARVRRRYPSKSRSSPWSLVITGATLVFTIVAAIYAVPILFRSTEGTLVLEANEPNVDVLIDNRKVAVKRRGRVVEVPVAPGRHDVEVRKPGFTPHTTTISVSNSEQVFLTVYLERAGAGVKPRPAKTGG